MFEMFVTLINLLILTTSDTMVTRYLFSFMFTCEALLHRGYSPKSSTLHIREFAVGICHENLPWLFATSFCRGNLSQEFAVAICRRDLPWFFAAGICCGFLPQKFFVAVCRKNLAQELAVEIYRMFFVFVSKTFFVYVSKSCLYGSKPFLYESKTFLFVRFSLLTVFFFAIAVAVMGHWKLEHLAFCAFFGREL